MNSFDEIKNIISEAAEDNSADSKGQVLTKIMEIEKDCHYNNKSSRERMKKLREVIDSNVELES